MPKHKCEHCNAQFNKHAALNYHQKQIKKTIRGNEILCAYNKRKAKEAEQPKYLLNIFDKWRLFKIKE